MSAPTFKVLIAGGGIAGPCLAFWISRTKLNVHITIIERSPTPRVTGQAVDIRGRAVKIIQRMSLEEIILAKNTTETGTAFVNSKGEIIAQFDADGDKSATSEFEILRADLATIFLEATIDRNNVEYVYGESINSLIQDDEGAHVTFTGGRTAETFDLVVGADGQASQTRSVAFDQSIPANPYNTLGMYVAYFSIPSRPDDTKLWRWYAAPKGRSVMLRPHQDASTVGAYLCVTMPSRTEKDPAMVNAMEQGNEEVKKLLHGYFKDVGWQASRVLEGMETAKDFYITSWDQVRMPKWTNGRVGLIGDAGFATPGAGTSLAIESAFYLAGELSKVGSSEEIPAALERYEKILRPLVEPNQKLPPGAPQILNPQTSWGISILNIVLWGVYRTSAYKLFGGFGGATGAGKDWTLPDYSWAGL